MTSSTPSANASNGTARFSCSPGQLEGIPLQVIIAGQPSVSFQRDEWAPGHGLDDWPIPDDS